jgi:signal transduction histidine kinase
VERIKIAFLNIIVNAVEESQPRIFEPYFTNKSKGTGLGLTNTQNIILNHNGQIAFESKKGEGTTFTIQLNFA